MSDVQHTTINPSAAPRPLEGSLAKPKERGWEEQPKILIREPTPRHDGSEERQTGARSLVHPRKKTSADRVGGLWITRMSDDPRRNRPGKLRRGSQPSSRSPQS